MAVAEPNNSYRGRDCRHRRDDPGKENFGPSAEMGQDPSVRGNSRGEICAPVSGKDRRLLERAAKPRAANLEVWNEQGQEGDRRDDECNGVHGPKPTLTRPPSLSRRDC